MLLRSCSTHGAVVAAFSLGAVVGNNNNARAENAPPPVPHIYFQGSEIVNSNPIIVAIGQQISLSADQSGSKRKWSIDPSTSIFGTPSIDPDCPISPETINGSCLTYSNVYLNKTTTLFYFAIPGTYIVTYKYSDSDGSAEASVTFMVEGPTSPQVSAKISNVNLTPLGCTSNCQSMDLGDYNGGVYGILLKGSASLPHDFTGNFTWAQIIDDGIDYTDTNGDQYTCPIFEGIDITFPYPYTHPKNPIKFNILEDTPYITLDGLTYVIRDFFALDYLMWQPKESSYVQNPAPVALGFVTWGFYGQASFDSNQNQWSLSSNVQQPQFTAGYDPPGWNSVVAKGNPSYPGTCTKQ